MLYPELIQLGSFLLSLCLDAISQQEHCPYALATLELSLRWRIYIESCIPTSGMAVNFEWLHQQKMCSHSLNPCNSNGTEACKTCQNLPGSQGKKGLASMVKIMLPQKTKKGLFKSPLGTSLSGRGWRMSFPSSLVIQNLNRTVWTKR